MKRSFNTAMLCVTLVALTISTTLLAQAPEPPPVLEGRPDAERDKAGPNPLLGGVFESLSAGVAFRAPAGCKEIRRAVSGDEIVQYINDAKKWHLRVGRAQFAQPLPLDGAKDAKGKSQPGLLELTIRELKRDKPGAEILREDIITVGDATVGMIAAKYSIGLETHLLQQAIVRASDRYYFIFTLVTPAPRQAELADDAGVQEAVNTFNAVLDSVRLLDQSEIKEEQNQRLFRTRSLFLNISETRLRNALIKEQWMRLIRDGKDIGYMYVVEEIAADLPRKNAPKRPTRGEGVRIGMRTRTIPEPGAQVDAEAWMWMSFDRRHEQWSSAAVIQRGPQDSTYVSEFGATDKSNLSEARGEEKYHLSVTHMSKTKTAQPVERELPVFYIPQALGHLLPRLAPRFEPKGYMFATYVSDQREVMARYVDVGREEEVTLGGQRVRAIPMDDRIGLEGPVTTHYVSPDDGRYLGSVNAESKITILPTDRKTLESMWKDANLTRPQDIEEK